MVRNQMAKIFKKVKNSSSCHQKYIQLLTDLYKRTEFEEFTRNFIDFLQIFFQHATETNEFVKRTMCFCSKFSSAVTQIEEKNNEEHNFLTRVINQTLYWSCLDIYELRFNACSFVTKLLQDIGENIQLEINLIDELQRVMLERMQEPKVAIRLKAMSALVRLQDPENYDCPVINAYLEALASGNATIRKEALNIAPNSSTLGKIADRVRDIDPNVRSAAFYKCADIGSKHFKIVFKQQILLCGFKETNANVKRAFYDYLLPKWLTDYKGSFMNFVAALKLIADENDIEKMTYLGKELIRDFYNKHSVNDLIDALPLNNAKVVDVDNITNEVTLYWNVISALLRESGDTEEYLSRVLPELTPFCHYLERVIKAKSREKMDEWKLLEYQFDLKNLFEIAENYDFSDEVGRRTMYSFVTSILLQESFCLKLTRILVSIAQKCSSNLEFFTTDMCQLISDIKEPLIDEPLSQDQQRERDFKLAELKVKKNILQEQQNEAVADRDYQKAQLIDNELVVIEKQLNDLKNKNETEKVKTIRSDDATLCRCLDILISVLENKDVSQPTPALITCKEHFLKPLIGHRDPETHWRILKCLSLFSIIDKITADQYAQLIALPICTYRTMPINNVLALGESVIGVTDLISIYGIEIVGGENDTIVTQNSTKRRLYNNETEEDHLSISRHGILNFSDIFDIFLDMLDDEREELRHKAARCMTVLIQFTPFVTPTLISRIMLKWYSPLTEKQDPKLQVRLGLFIEYYLTLKSSRETLKDAIFPTLSSIANAPQTSPLADIDTDNVLLFFAEIVNIRMEKDELRFLALDVCMRISEKTNNKVILLLSKFLCHLDLFTKNQELIDRTEMLLENVTDRVSKKYLEKFLYKLKQQTALTDFTASTNSTNEIEQVNNVLRDMTLTENERTNPNSCHQIKRKKRRTSKECVVILEKFDNEKKNEQVFLPKIVEDSLEGMDVDDVSIETPSTGENTQERVNIVISETSSSDLGTNNGVQRKSKRLRKKGIF